MTKIFFFTLYSFASLNRIKNFCFPKLPVCRRKQRFENARCSCSNFRSSICPFWTNLTIRDVDHSMSLEFLCMLHNSKLFKTKRSLVQITVSKKKHLGLVGALEWLILSCCYSSQGLSQVLNM